MFPKSIKTSKESKASKRGGVGATPELVAVADDNNIEDDDDDEPSMFQYIYYAYYDISYY